MKLQKYIPLPLALASLPLFSSFTENSNSKKDVKPNFIIINIDDLGYSEVEPFGCEVNLTPNISKMAEEGTLLTSFYAASARCSPARAALLTGCYPPRVGLGMGSEFVVLMPGDTLGINEEEVTLAEHLKSAGYATACIGKWHLGDQPEFLPENHGFDYYYGIPYSNDMWPQLRRFNFPPLPLLRGHEVIDTINTEKKQSLLCQQFTDEAIAFIEKNSDNPFFLYLPHSFIHTPRIARDSFLLVTPNPDKNTGGVISEIDHSVGQILAALKDLEIDNNTMVWFMSDNGGTSETANYPLRGTKGSYWEGGFRVPGIVRWPDKIPAGKRLDGIVTQIDIYPTLASFAGLTAPKGQITDGIDVSGYLTGKEKASPREVFYYYNENDLSAVRYQNWKLFYSGQLYNLEDDIGEENDVSQQNPEIVSILNGYLEMIRKDIGDARLGIKGENIRPAGKKTENLKFIIPATDEDGNPITHEVVRIVDR